MHRARLATLSIAVLVALVGAQTAAADDPTIYIHYSYNCTFTVLGDTGSTISVVPPGKYQILVTSPQAFAEVDLSGVADPTYACGGFVSFHLTGPGVSLATTLDDGDGLADQMQATFQAGGTYTMFDDRRPTLRPTFTAQAGAASTGGGGSVSNTATKPATEKKAVDPKGLVGTLNGSVDTKGKLTLTFKGKKVSSLKAGRYRLTVLDETSKLGFSLLKHGAKKATNVTTVPYLGRNTILITLKAGKWFFYSPSATKRTFTVS
jgi:hypothetical protein